MYARSRVVPDAGGDLPVITFGPVSVAPEFQRRGVGRALIEYTLQLAREMGYSAVFIYGDPAYYGRLNFQPAERYQIGTSDNDYHDSLQAYVLKPGALDNAAGRFFEDPAYHLDETAAGSLRPHLPAQTQALRYPLPAALPQSHRHAQAAGGDAR